MTLYTHRTIKETSAEHDEQYSEDLTYNEEGSRLDDFDNIAFPMPSCNISRRESDQSLTQMAGLEWLETSPERKHGYLDNESNNQDASKYSTSEDASDTNPESPLNKSSSSVKAVDSQIEPPAPLFHVERVRKTQ